jgi:hypothetical protein
MPSSSSSVTRGSGRFSSSFDITFLNSAFSLHQGRESIRERREGMKKGCQTLTGENKDAQEEKKA